MRCHRPDTRCHSLACRPDSTNISNSKKEAIAYQHAEHSAAHERIAEVHRDEHGFVPFRAPNYDTHTHSFAQHYDLESRAHFEALATAIVVVHVLEAAKRNHEDDLVRSRAVAITTIIQREQYGESHHCSWRASHSNNHRRIACSLKRVEVLPCPRRYGAAMDASFAWTAGLRAWRSKWQQHGQSRAAQGDVQLSQTCAQAALDRKSVV